VLKRRVWRITAAAATGAALLLAPTTASATTAGVRGSLRRGAITHYSNARKITVSGSSIKFRKTDGPTIDVRWERCSNRSVHGAWVRFRNADPTPRITIGTNFRAGTVFCLAAWDHGSNATDTFSGALDWNVR